VNPTLQLSIYGVIAPMSVDALQVIQDKGVYGLTELFVLNAK
jgi:hypothetical protein